MLRNSLNTGAIVKKSLIPISAGYALVLLTFFLPTIDSTRAPYFDLTSPFARAVNLVSATGTLPWVVAVAALGFVVLWTGPGPSLRQRLREALVLLPLALVSVGLGAYLNEHWLKETWDVPRPNILALAAQNGPLKMTAEDFYALGNKQARSAALATVLAAEPAGFEMDPRVRAHWIEESGYSRPSGHAFAAWFFATFFLAFAISGQTRGRRRLFYLLVPWAVAVCYSRLILRVHSPTDIALGGLMGVTLAIAAFVLGRWLLTRWAHSTAAGRPQFP